MSDGAVADYTSSVLKALFSTEISKQLSTDRTWVDLIGPCLMLGAWCLMFRSHASCLILLTSKTWVDLHSEASCSDALML